MPPVEDALQFAALGAVQNGGLRVTNKELGWRLIVDGANRADDEGDSELRDALTALGSRVLRA